MMRISEFVDPEIKHCYRCGKPLRVYGDSFTDKHSPDGCRAVSMGMAYWMCDESCCPKHNQDVQ